MGMDLVHEELVYKSHNNPMNNTLILTWKYNEIACPHLSFMMETRARPEAPELGFELPLDFQDEMVWYVKKARKRNDMVLEEGEHMNTVSNKSCANCGYDRLQAWDVTVLRPNLEEAAEVAWQVWRYVLRLKAIHSLLRTLECGREEGSSRAGVHKGHGDQPPPAPEQVALDLIGGTW